MPARVSMPRPIGWSGCFLAPFCIVVRLSREMAIVDSACFYPTLDRFLLFAPPGCHVLSSPFSVACSVHGARPLCFVSLFSSLFPPVLVKGSLSPSRLADPVGVWLKPDLAIQFRRKFELDSHSWSLQKRATTDPATKLRHLTTS